MFSRMVLRKSRLIPEESRLKEGAANLFILQEGKGPALTPAVAKSPFNCSLKRSQGASHWQGLAGPGLCGGRSHRPAGPPTGMRPGVRELAPYDESETARPREPCRAGRNQLILSLRC